MFYTQTNKKSNNLDTDTQEIQKPRHSLPSIPQPYSPGWDY